MTEKKKPLRYFFLNGDLHRKIHINRSADSIRAWNYPKARLMTYVYSDVKKMGERAFTTREVSEMIGRDVRTIEVAILAGNIREPQSTYGLDENRNKYKYMWNEKAIMELHAYFLTVHKGRPRKDGLVTPMAMPTAKELRAMIRQDVILYVKQGDKFIPTWKAE